MSVTPPQKLLQMVALWTPSFSELEKLSLLLSIRFLGGGQTKQDTPLHSVSDHTERKTSP